MLSMDSDEETDWTVQQIHSVYESPFLDQFEPVKLLHAAANGSSSTFNSHRVFEAKKRSDGKLYAVKRIKLPAGKEARAQIIKELTVLCELSHRNIVKYFDAWREFPPTGWQDDQDAHHLARLSASDEEDLDSNNKPIRQKPPAATFASIFGANSLHQMQASNTKPIHQQVKSKSSGDPLGLATPPQMTKMKNVDQYLYLRMELCRRESLAEWLVTYHQPVPTAKRQDVIAMFREILQGVQHLHLNDLIHRDLKPSNIFFSADGTIKVGDLGLGVIKQQQQQQRPSSWRVSWTNNEQTQPVDLLVSSSQQQTTADADDGEEELLYTSPEQLESSRRYNHKVDVYALAVILFELLVPFSSKSERHRVIGELKSTLTFPPTFQKLHPQAETLLIKMLSYNPDHRPEIKALLADAWISGRIRDSSNVTRRPSSSNKAAIKPQPARFKILVIGDQNTGKTSIIHRYIRGEFLDPQQVTIGAVVNLKQVTWNEGDSDDGVKREMTLEFCDIGGEERSRFMTSAFYRRAVGAFVVMDVTQPNGFQAATLWKKDLDTKLRMHDDSLVPSVLLINKCDGATTKYSSSELDPAQVDRYCRQNKFSGWFDTSALNDINIDEAVQLLLGKILANEAAAVAAAASSLNKEAMNATHVDDLPRKLEQSSSTEQPTNKKKSNCC